MADHQSIAKQHHAAVSFRPISEAIVPLSYFKRESRHWLASIGGITMLILFGIIIYANLLLVWYTIDYLQGNPDLYVRTPLRLYSKLNGQFAILLFSIDFILATRTRLIEKLFGGFDRVYKMHALVGRIGFFLALLHFILLIADAPLAYALEYFWPSEAISILYGQIALALFFILVAVSIWVKIPYHIWLWTHKCIGVAFLFSGLHVWFVEPMYVRFDPYRTIFTVIWFLGMYAWLHKLLLYKFVAPKFRGTVVKVVQRHDIVDLYIQIKNEKFSSRPGDFVFISMNHTRRQLMKEQHPFSISGYYENGIIRLSIKDLGDFTHKIGEAAPGDRVTIFGPYGKFDDKLFSRKNDMVWIGGGIGIAPFTYMAQYFGQLPASGAEGKRKAALFHSVRGVDEAIYTDEFEKAHQADQDFTYQVWDTQTHGFLTAEAIATSVGGVDELKKRLVFMCGPLPMMHAISKQLLDMGLKPSQIVFEEFAFG